MSALHTVALVAAFVSISGSAFAGQPTVVSQHTHAQDYVRLVDAGEIELYVSNVGSFGYDIAGSPAGGGGIFPAGSGKNFLFAGGLCIGAIVDGALRVTVAEYSMEYLPGPILPDGQPDDPNRPEHVVYKVVRFAGDPKDTAHVERATGGLLRDRLEHHSWSEYMHGAAPYGAPWRLYRLPLTATPAPNDSTDVPGPLVFGDQMLWSVYNDAEPSAHTNSSGSTAPLGIEVRQSTSSFRGPPSLSRYVFLRYEIRNRSTNYLHDTYFSVWTDPEIGGFSDDFCASSPECDLGYAYNMSNIDEIYGRQAPAFGVFFLETPIVAGDTLGMTSFVKYHAETDSPQQTYNYMQGLQANGQPIIDPITGRPTTYFVSGDPVTGTGWLDAIPSDRRMMLSTGPFDFAPGETRQLIAVLAVGQGTNRITSIQSLRSSLGQTFSRCEQPEPATNCPQPATFWQALCASDPMESALPALAARVNEKSTYFDWPSADSALIDAYCAALEAASAAPRARAEREFAAFLTNYCAEGATIDGSPPIQLLYGTPFTCPATPGWSIGELAATAPSASELLSVSYVNELSGPIPHRTALTGVDWSQRTFWLSGGAGYANDFFSGTAFPPSETDSFANVEIRFTGSAQGQKAYRYLRLEQVDGTPPWIGRGYLYGGFVDVPFQVWDVDRNVQLEAAFVERTATDAAGNPLPPEQQPATHDDSWAPDSTDTGGHESVFVLRPAYSGVEAPTLAVDGAISEADAPALYAVWSKRRSASDVIDPGDLLRFEFGLAPSPGADALLISLAARPQDDPEVLGTYTQLADCLADINLGIGVDPNCMSTPSIPSIYEARVVDGVAHLRWLTSDGQGIEGRVQRRNEIEGWTAIGRVVSDHEGFFTFDDPFPLDGGRWGYRLGLQRQDGERFYGEVWLEAPSFSSIALGPIVSPARGALAVPVTIAAGTAVLELFDVRGRRVTRQRIERDTPGREVVQLAPGGSVASGVYIVRLTQAGESVHLRAVLIR